jgi:hypothetical protein
MRRSAGEKMRTIEENYQRITDNRRSFDIRFWQAQGDRAIFEAVLDILHDYFLIRGKGLLWCHILGLLWCHILNCE